MKRLVLIDGHNLLFRMFYGIPVSIKNSKGVEIRGVTGFIGAIKKINASLKADAMAVIFDSETSKNNNVSLLDDYKSNRPDFTNVADDENPFIGLPIIKKALAYLSVSFYEVIDNEADDYIASLARKYKRFYDEIIIVSNDSDFFQLIDSKIFIYVLRGKEGTLFDSHAFKEKYHIMPSQYVEYKSLIGDHADNIPGVRGIGKVTAEEILKYSSIKDYLNKSTNDRVKTLLTLNEDIIARNIKLISLNKSLDTSKLKLNIANDKIDKSRVYEVLEAIGER